MRLISLTKFLSIVFENYISKWIFEIVKPLLDPGQFGATKGDGISHYLIHLINFILVHLDSTESTAVTALIVDYSKAFNRMSHLRLLTIMYEMGIPGWLLKLTASYLSNRTLVVRYGGSTLTERELPGGAPQGTLLGVLAFILQMTGIRPVPPIPLSEIITAPRVKQQNTSAKYIDDQTTASVIKLKKLLKPQDIPIRPVPYHSRTELYLPDNVNPLLDQLNSIIQFAHANQMKLNTKNTVVMTFTRSRTLDFQPKLFLDEKLLDVVESSRLIGIMFSSDLKWHLHVKFITKKFMKKLWALRRTKDIGGSTKDLLNVYMVQMRCLAEQGCPAWNGALTIMHQVC